MSPQLLPAPAVEERLDWDAVAERIGYDEIRRRLTDIATEQGEWAGIPIPVAGMDVVVANQRQSFAPIWPAHVRRDTVNSWQVRKSYTMWLFRDEDGKTRGYPDNYWSQRFLAMFDTLYARRAVLPESEMVAFAKLLDHLNDGQARDYVLSNMFVERGPRSDLLYVFRRGLPVLTFRSEGEQLTPRAALCLHPLAYYARTHAGALAPSDEVLALLLMMRAGEPFLWRKANQLDIRDPMVAI